MLQENALNGKHLARKTLCLTFDDGPGESDGKLIGPKTSALAEYLFSEKISAAFFVTGKHALEYPHTLRRIYELNHIIGNHTYSHPHLIERFEQGEDVTKELTLTSRILTAAVPLTQLYFRAPWGQWSRELCARLNDDSEISQLHIGPIGWDINGHDWDFWRRDKPPEICASHFLHLIETQKKGGIVLMHDSTADNEKTREKNDTLSLARILIPQLKAKGYKFVCLHEVCEGFTQKFSNERV